MTIGKELRDLRSELEAAARRILDIERDPLNLDGKNARKLNESHALATAALARFQQLKRPPTSAHTTQGTATTKDHR